MKNQRFLPLLNFSSNSFLASCKGGRNRKIHACADQCMHRMHDSMKEWAPAWLLRTVCAAQLLPTPSHRMVQPATHRPVQPVLPVLHVLPTRLHLHNTAEPATALLSPTQAARAAEPESVCTPHLCIPQLHCMQDYHHELLPCMLLHSHWNLLPAKSPHKPCRENYRILTLLASVFLLLSSTTSPDTTPLRSTSRV